MCEFDSDEVVSVTFVRRNTPVVYTGTIQSIKYICGQRCYFIRFNGGNLRAWVSDWKVTRAKR